MVFILNFASSAKAHGLARLQGQLSWRIPGFWADVAPALDLPPLWCQHGAEAETD